MNFREWCIFLIKHFIFFRVFHQDGFGGSYDSLLFVICVVFDDSHPNRCKTLCCDFDLLLDNCVKSAENIFFMCVFWPFGIFFRRDSFVVFVRLKQAVIRLVGVFAHFETRLFIFLIMKSYVAQAHSHRSYHLQYFFIRKFSFLLMVSFAMKDG